MKYNQIKCKTQDYVEGKPEPAITLSFIKKQSLNPTLK